jgi:hypothetical protein
MSRSKKSPSYKDNGMPKSMYNRVVRHNWNQELRINWDKETLEFKNPKTMINDYTFSDYSFTREEDPYIKAFFYEYDPIKDWHGITEFQYHTTKEDVKKLCRK